MLASLRLDRQLAAGVAAALAERGLVDRSTGGGEVRRPAPSTSSSASASAAAAGDSPSPLKKLSVSMSSNSERTRSNTASDDSTSELETDRQTDRYVSYCRGSQWQYSNCYCSTLTFRIEKKYKNK